MSYTHVGAVVSATESVLTDRLTFDYDENQLFKSFTLARRATAKILAVGGGGAGGTYGGAGGGGGGFIESELVLEAGAYSVQVGGGGPGTGYRSAGADGDLSFIHQLGTAIVLASGGQGGRGSSGSAGGGDSGEGYIGVTLINASVPGQASAYGAGAGSGFAGTSAGGGDGQTSSQFGGIYGGGGGGSVNGTTPEPGGEGGGGDGGQSSVQAEGGTHGLGGGGGATWNSGGYPDDTYGGHGIIIVELTFEEVVNDSDYGKIQGAVTIDGEIAAGRKVIGISYVEVDTGEVDGTGGPIFEHRIVGSATSGDAGEYVLDMPGYFDQVVVMAMDTYGETWRPNRSYGVGIKLRPTVGNETGYNYVCTIAGVSDPIEPVWWIDDGGNNTGSVGTATFEAIPSWAPVAHAPILPIYVQVGNVLYPLELDPYFDDNFCLMPFEGANGSTDFTGVFGRTWTAIGSPVISTVAAKAGTSSLLLTDGDFIQDDVKDDWTFLHDGTEDWTIEAWINFDTNVWQCVLDNGGSGSLQRGIGFNVDANGFLDVTISRGAGGGNYTARVTGATAMATGTWHHVAAVVSGNGTLLETFANGVSQGTDTLGITSATAPQYKMLIGRYAFSAIGQFIGKIDDLRVTRGVARYLEDFTPPALALPVTRFEPGREPTILDPYFDDTITLYHFEEDSLGELQNSVTGPDAVDIDVFNSPIVSSDTAQYGSRSLRFVAGSHAEIRFHTSSGVTWADQGAADCTIEGFFIFKTGDDVPIFAQGASGAGSSTGTEPLKKNGIQISYLADGQIKIRAGNLGSYGSYMHIETAPGALPFNVWTHFAFTIENNIPRVFVNGVNFPLTADSGTYPLTDMSTMHLYNTMPFNINAVHFDAGLPANDVKVANSVVKNNIDYIDEVRVTPGVARYTSSFTVPAEAFPDFEYDPLENLAAAAVHPVELDPYFVDVISLAHFDNDFTATVGPQLETLNGATISAVDPKFGGGSVELAGASNVRSISPHLDNTEIQLNGCTIEAWIYPDDLTVDRGIIYYGDPTSDSNRVQIILKSTGKIEGYMRINGSTNLVELYPNDLLSIDEWAHVALVLDAAESRLYVNGNLIASAVYAPPGAWNGTHEIRVGFARSSATQRYFSGKIDDTRITNTARYTGNFTPPILAHPDARFEAGKEPTILDPLFSRVELSSQIIETFDSVNDQVWTQSGGVFEPAGGVFSGDGYFKMSGDGEYASTPDADGSLTADGDFTIEAFIYPITTRAAGFNAIFCKRLGGGVVDTSDYNLWIENTKLRLFVSDTSGGTSAQIHSATVVPINQWSHVALVRDDASGVWELFLNGASEGTSTEIGTLRYNYAPLFMGRDNSVTTRDFHGGISHVRVTRTKRYTAPFTPPAEPFPLFEYDPLEDLGKRTEVDALFDLTTVMIPGDTDLTNYGSAGPVTVNGNAASSVAQNKFGGGSVFLDGTDDDLQVDAGIYSESLQVTEAMTIEAWVYPSSVASDVAVFGTRKDNPANPYGFQLRMNSGGVLRLFAFSSPSTLALDVTAASGLTVNTWGHVALTFDGLGNWKVYVNGLEIINIAETGTTGAHSGFSDLRIGNSNNGDQDFFGFFDDIRVTKALRYSAPFTPATGALPISRYTYEE